MKTFIQRLREPSTWAGVAILAGLFGVDPNKVAAVGHAASAIAPFVPVDGGVLAQAVAGISAAVAVLLPETRTTAPAAPAASE